MDQKSVMLLTGANMASIDNECGKIALCFRSHGCVCDYYLINRDHPRFTRLPRYGLALWFTPFLPMYFGMETVWLNIQKEDLALCYYVIEGHVHGAEFWKDRLNWQVIVTPSEFAKRCVEGHGLTVKEVIPHQVSPNPLIDYAYGRAWRARFPSSKTVILYSGSQINRKGLPFLREAINLLSQKRSDFLMVFHTDHIRQTFHTPTWELDGVNTVVETDFPHLTPPQALAKMFYSDIVVHPALTEGFGLPVLEALNMGKPLVCINAPAVNEIATPQNSFMVTDVKPQKLEWSGYITFDAVTYAPQALADQLTLALDATPEILASKRLAGIETAKKYHHSYDAFLKFLL